MKLIKLLCYVVIFYFFGFYYGKFTEGTVFDHFLIMLAILFLVIFLLEWMFSKRKKHNIDVKEETDEDETFAELMRDVQKEFEKTWQVNYEYFDIRIVNQYNGEQLFVNDKLIAEKKRTTWYSWLKMTQTLKGTLDDDGKKTKIVVKLGGLLSLNCAVYVNKKLIFQDKIEYNIFTGETKDKDRNEK